MNELAQKRLAFLKETAAHYNSTNRCSTAQGCRYSPVTLHLQGKSEGCAIGRKLDPELALALDNTPHGGVVNAARIWKQLPAWMQELEEDFLRDVQQLHDTSDYWDDNGISKLGKIWFDNIIRKYGIYN